MRRSHILTLAKKLIYPSDLVFIDTETTTLTEDEESIRPKLIVGVSQYVKLDKDLNIIDFNQLVFYRVHTLHNWLLSIFNKNKQVTVFAHNWAFDFPVIDGFHFMENNGFELKMIVDGSPPVILKYVDDTTLVMIIDSLNFFPFKLEKLGDMVGVKKHKNVVLGKYSSELELYCIDDVNILRLSILGLLTFLKDNDLCRFNHTTSSIALNTFWRRFLKDNIFIDGDIKKTMLGRKSYFGGRTECFKIGRFTGKFYLIDVNSMYPFVMRSNKYPVKTFKRSLSCNVEDLPQLLENYHMTVECIVNTDQPIYPKVIDTRTCFPIGEFEAYLSTPEVIHALSNKHIKSVSEVILYERKDIFSSYVNYFYNLRNNYKADGNLVYAELSKLLMNSLYGKFGQSHKAWEESDREPTGIPHTEFVIDGDEMKRVYIMEIGGKVFEATFTIESRDSYPAIAAHVTAYARVFLFNTMQYVGRENIYYCDTDSLLLNQKGYNKIKDKLSDTILGCWACEGVYENINIRGNKDYVFDTKHKVKGIKGNAEFLEKNTFRQLQFGSLTGVIRSHRTNAPIIKYINKSLTREYKKGYVLPSGDISPFVISLDDD
ncbi:MAG: hypothetical protein H8D23_18630 [Candidatus Brocadiales bacterium]|nr:hypothetical protein [Candidatus Brocadiales bacterium]